ncbi:hypothetical protein CEXT_208651 [Caerostris extrusa]|uniref:Uncharacterized protein n=1 Tax=Caerostris extrusa TaxID=172846 RepID=A0AAV4P5W5_CAEEX|nr:hypothetical protein CEXT_208651 [Caerostris extrusa]
MYQVCRSRSFRETRRDLSSEGIFFVIVFRWAIRIHAVCRSRSFFAEQVARSVEEGIFFVIVFRWLLLFELLHVPSAVVEAFSHKRSPGYFLLAFHCLSMANELICVGSPVKKLSGVWARSFDGGL